MTATRSELDQLRESLRSFIDRRSPISARRRRMESTQDDTAGWDSLSAELGLQALGIPVEYDGLGFGPVEQAVVMEELGRALAFPAYLSSSALAAAVITHVAAEEFRAMLLPDLASGQRRATAAFGEDSWSQGMLRPTSRAVAVGDGWMLNGVKRAVLDGGLADTLLVTATTVRGLALFLVDAGVEGVTRSTRAVLDLTRPQSDIEFSCAPARLISGGTDTLMLLERARDIAIAALAVENIGGAERCLEMTRDFLLQRSQFGRTLAGFQALKHRCADMMVEIETARAVVKAAAQAAADESWEDLKVLSSVAQARASDVFSRVAADAIQLHGAIGFTWEHDAHLYLKRAKASAAVLGTPSEHRVRATGHLAL